MRTLFAALALATLAACGGGNTGHVVKPQATQAAPCKAMFAAAYLVRNGQDDLRLTGPQHANLDPAELGELGLLYATRAKLQGDVHVGDWCEV